MESILESIPYVLWTSLAQSKEVSAIDLANCQSMTLTKRMENEDDNYDESDCSDSVSPTAHPSSSNDQFHLSRNVD